MAASQIELAARGQEDRWLTESPSRTFFEAKYKPRINRLRETLEIPFDYQGVTFGTTGQSTIPVKGDYLTGLTLRAVLPPIYPVQPGQYVFPTPSSQVGGSVYVNMGLTQIVANGTTLTANTSGNHYFSNGAAVILTGTAYSIFDLDGVYTINGIPTANSFTCSTVLSGISFNGTASTVGILCGDVVSYFSTQNSNLWVNNLTNKTWQITGGTNVGNVFTFTTSAPSNFLVGSQVVLNLPDSGLLNQAVTVSASTDTTFTCTINGFFVIVALLDDQAYSTDNGLTWTAVTYPLSGIWNGITYGNDVFAMVGTDVQARSTDNGFSWSSVGSPLTGIWTDVAFGNGVFAMVGTDVQARSTDNGFSWSSVGSPLTGLLNGVTFGNGFFVMVGTDVQGRSTDNGFSWSYAGLQLAGFWSDVAFGNGVFVMVGSYVFSAGKQARSIDNGATWTNVASPLSGIWNSVTFGNGVFVMVGTNKQARSTNNGVTWTNVASPLSGTWSSVIFSNGVFVMVGTSTQARSIDNGLTWTYVSSQLVGSWSGLESNNFVYTNSASDSVSLAMPPFQLLNRDFISTVYPSISFQNSSDAAFWGFDSRSGLTYSFDNGVITPPWSLVQSGWIPGFLPPSSSVWDDSVAHKLCKAIRIMVGKQTIKEYSGEYIELLNDLTVDYANKAILKLMNGTLDQTQSIVSREYYVSLPLGTREIPLCALTHQNMSVEIDFERYTNLSRSLNPGTGVFTDPKSFVTYNATTGILNGSPLNVQTTFSYQQYIFIVTYDGLFVIYDTSKPVSDSTSYTVLSAFSGTNVFRQFCVLSGILYIGLSDGTLARFILDEIIQGIISSFELNNYTPTIGSLTGTIVADFRYVYYAVSNTVTSNVFVSQYDTTSSFTSAASYKTVDFTLNFNSSVDGVYQFISTGTELVMLPMGTPGSLYTFQLNANVQSQWYTLDYSGYGYQITEGVLIGNDLYFVCDNFNILKYSNSVFLLSILQSYFIMTGNSDQEYSTNNGISWTSVASPLSGSWRGITSGNDVSVMVGTNKQAYSTDNGFTWTNVASPLSGNWNGVTFGNGVFVMVSTDNKQAYSTNNGLSWTNVAFPLSGLWLNVTFGNGTFVMVTANKQAYSTDNGFTWTNVASPLSGNWNGVTFGNGVFVMVGTDKQAYSTNNGLAWTSLLSPVTGGWSSVAFGNGVFVMVGTDKQAYSTNNGLAWTSLLSPVTGNWRGVTFGNGVFVMVGDYLFNGTQARSTNNGLSWNLVASPVGLGVIFYSVATVLPERTIPGDQLRNLLAVGNYIYCSTSNVAVQIDTTKDLLTATFPAPVPTGQYVFANGPRYVYLFSQGDATAQNVYRFDPYPPNTNLKASIIVDYESLPSDVAKPDKALIGLVQTQKVTNMDVMDLRGPVKELWITGASSTTNVFQYANLSNQVTLTFTAGEEMITPDTGTRKMLSVIQPFEMHTSMPIRNVSTFSFEMDPESSTPNGTVNFSRIYEQALTANAATVWAGTITYSPSKGE